MATNIVGATGIDKVQDGIIVNADIDTVAASKLTGALPAISGASLTNLPADATKLPLAGGTMTGNLSITKASASTILTSTGSGNDASILFATPSNSRGMYLDDSDSNKLKFYTGYGKGVAGKEVTFDNEGKVGIGRTDPAALLHLQATVPELRFTYTGNSGYAHIKSNDNSELIFSTGTTDGQERMRIDSTGVPMIGMTSKTQTISSQAAMYFAPTGSSNAYASLYIVHNSAQKHGIVMKDMNSGGGTQLDFFNSSGTRTGHIYQSSSATTYSTASDYRLKENVDYTWDATTRLKQLKPARFNFKADDSLTLDGFLAHEVSSIVPEAVIGEKDATEMQCIDQSKLVPLLVKTIQELEARLTAGGL